LELYHERDDLRHGMETSPRTGARRRIAGEVTA